MGALVGWDRSWRTVAVVSSAAAGALHLAAARPHMAEWLPAGLFMLAAGLAQLGWCVWIVRGGADLATFAGVVGNASVVALWVATRTSGLPFGPNAGMREHLHGPDVLATLLEVVVVVVCFRGLPVSRPPRAVLIATAFAVVSTVAVVADDPVGDRAIAVATLGSAAVGRAVAGRIPDRFRVRRSNEWAPHLRAIVRRSRALGRAVIVIRGSAAR